MKWTKEKPNKEGHYWARHDGKQVVIYVIARHPEEKEDEWRVCTTLPNEFGTPLNWYKEEFWEWAGPIPLPTE